VKISAVARKSRDWNDEDKQKDSRKKRRSERGKLKKKE
jgi:hypothetical protein